jgi:predicted RNase H-like HicB family nuclease
MAVVTLSAVIHREDDLYVAECPELGTVSQGARSRRRSPI